MNKLDVESIKHRESLIATLSSPLDSYSFKTVFKTIPDELADLLSDTNPNGDLNNNPRLVILSIVNLDENNPCGVCSEAVDQLKQWGLDNGAIGDGRVRVLIVPELDDSKLWNKLNVDADEVPRHYIFNKDLALIDVVNGVMNGGYIETFYGRLINEE